MKLRKSVLFKIILAIIAALALLNVAVYGGMYLIMNSEEIAEAFGVFTGGTIGLDVHSVITIILTSDTNCITYVAVVLIILICGEFKDRTLQNALVTGHSRFSVSLAKLFTSEIVFIACIIIYYAVSFGVMRTFVPYTEGYDYEFWKDFVIILINIISNLGSIAILWMLIFLVKSIGASLALTLPLTVLIMPIISAITTFSTKISNVCSWLPFANSTILVKEFNSIISCMEFDMPFNDMDPTKAMILLFVKLVVVFVFSFGISLGITKLTFDKSDLK